MTESVELPDGSGFFTASFPLPQTHWLYGTDGAGPPPMPLRVGTNDTRRRALVEAVWAAGKYAVRASTMCGREQDFDPDAMVQNFVVGLLGYFTTDGADSEAWGNPRPLPAGLDHFLSAASSAKPAPDEASGMNT